MTRPGMRGFAKVLLESLRLLFQRFIPLLQPVLWEGGWDF